MTKKTTQKSSTPKEKPLPKKATPQIPLSDMEIIKSLLREYKTAWKKLARI